MISHCSQETRPLSYGARTLPNCRPADGAACTRAVSPLAQLDVCLYISTVFQLQELVWEWEVTVVVYLKLLSQLSAVDIEETHGYRVGIHGSIISIQNRNHPNTALICSHLVNIS